MTLVGRSGMVPAVMKRDGSLWSGLHPNLWPVGDGLPLAATTIYRSLRCLYSLVFDFSVRTRKRMCSQVTTAVFSCSLRIQCNLLASVSYLRATPCGTGLRQARMHVDSKKFPMFVQAAEKTCHFKTGDKLCRPDTLLSRCTKDGVCERHEKKTPRVVENAGRSFHSAKRKREVIVTSTLKHFCHSW